VKKKKGFFEKLFSKKEVNNYQKLELLKKFLLFKNNYNFVIESINYESLNKYLE
jgi:hypothetical protein